MTATVPKKSGKKTHTKLDLVQAIASELNLSLTDTKHTIQSFLDKVSDALASGTRLELRDFGIFEVVTRKAKVGRNPKNASVSILIPPRKVVKFSPGKKMRIRIEKS